MAKTPSMTKPRIQIYLDQKVRDRLEAAADACNLKLSSWALSVLQREADKVLLKDDDPSKFLASFQDAHEMMHRIAAFLREKADSPLLGEMDVDVQVTSPTEE